MEAKQNQAAKVVFTKQELTAFQVSTIDPAVKSVQFFCCSAKDGMWHHIITSLSTLSDLKSVIFTNCNLGNSDTHTKAEAALESLRQIQELRLYGCRLGPHSVKGISQLTGLTELYLNFNNLGENVVYFESLVNLQKLGIKRCGIDEFRPPTFLLKLPKLQVLQINGPKDMRVIEQLHNLTELTLYRFEYGPDRIKRLAQFEKLTKLHLTGQFLKGNWLHYICQLTNLNDLKIDNLNNDTQIVEAECKKIANLQKLTKFVIKSCIDACAVKAIASLSYLTELDLSSSGLSKLTKIGDTGCEDLSTITMLMKLRLDYSNISDAGVRSLSQLINLEQLSIDGRYNEKFIGDVGANYIAQLRNLKVLNLNNNRIGDKGAKSIAKLANLKKLYLNRNAITDQGINSLAQIPNLEFLQIRENHIGNETIYSMRMLVKVKIIDLEFSQAIVDENGVALFEKMNRLEKLHINHRVRRYTFQFKRIQRRLPKTKINK